MIRYIPVNINGFIITLIMHLVITVNAILITVCFGGANVVRFTPAVPVSKQESTMNIFRMVIMSMCILAGAILEIAALTDGLARTPPMGFNTWNWFGSGNKNGAVTEALMKSMADAFVSSGMKDAGYQYVNVDDTWGDPARTSTGGIVSHKSRFPGGIKSLADYVHGKGLKFGLYSDVGVKTFTGMMPGMLGHENQDADSFVAWGADYVKVDFAGGDVARPDLQYGKIRDALRNAVNRMRPTVPSAHDLVFSICNAGIGATWVWGDTTGHLWRTTPDINASWQRVMEIYDVMASPYNLYRFAGMGAWNDPDMLEVGNGMTAAEDRAHFSLWCMLAAPLLAGNDIRTMSATTKGILTNKEVIAVDQDTLGGTMLRGVIQGRRVVNNGDLEVMAKKLKDMTTPDYAVCFLNRTSSAADISVSWEQIVTAGPGMTATTKYAVRDLWAHVDKGQWSGADGVLTAKSVPAHDVYMVRLSPAPVGVSTNGTARSMRAVTVGVMRGTIRVDGTGGTPASISLLDMQGKIVSSHRGALPLVWDAAGTGVTVGTYVAKVTTPESTVERRWVIMR